MLVFFEQALVNEGVPLQHWDRNLTVSMYITDVMTTPSGPFQRRHGCLHATHDRNKRHPFCRDYVSVSSHARFPSIHLGDPAQIGINDISKPDWGDAQEIPDNQMPVFWACGVTPQNAIRMAKPEICITHTPGSMLITDLPAHGNAALKD